MSNAGIREDLSRADEAVAEAARRLPDDPARPVCHYLPAACWMNDPNGPFFDEAGTLHMFHQFNPYGDKWGHMHWGHACSRDLVHWERLPVALAPDLQSGEEHCYSGCIVAEAGEPPVMLYTSRPFTGSYTQRLARPAGVDLRRWVQDSQPLLTLEHPGLPEIRSDWRDPFVFHVGARRFMVIGAATDAQGLVLLFESRGRSVADWRYRGVMVSFDAQDVSLPECPNMVPLRDGRWLLLVAPFRAVEALVGRFDPEAGEFHVEHRGSFDLSAKWYAPNMVMDPAGRPLIWGWIRGWEPGRGWNGCMSFPRVIWCDGEGRVRQRVADEVEQLRGEILVQRGGETSGAGTGSADLPDTLIDLEIDLQGERGDVSVTLEQGGTRETLQLSGEVVRHAGHTARLAEPVRHVRWLVDRSVSELFINHQAAITRVTDLRRGAVGLTWACDPVQGPAQALRVHSLRPIW